MDRTWRCEYRRWEVRNSIDCGHSCRRLICIFCTLNCINRALTCPNQLKDTLRDLSFDLTVLVKIIYSEGRTNFDFFRIYHFLKTYSITAHFTIRNQNSKFVGLSRTRDPDQFPSTEKKTGLVQNEISDGHT